MHKWIATHVPCVIRLALVCVNKLQSWRWLLDCNHKCRYVPSWAQYDFSHPNTHTYTDVLCLCFLIPQWKGEVPKLLAHLSLWRQHSFTHSGHLDAIWVESAENHYPGRDIIHLSKWAVYWIWLWMNNGKPLLRAFYGRNNVLNTL